jgi:filamentous hemagglutinin family protein
MKTVKELLITIICFTLVFPTSLLAAPSGGQVVRGNVTIKQTSTTTTIDQSSNRAIVNWKNFDIAKNEAVLHNMPGASSAALHRVVGGGGASQLAGLLRSNGNIFLVNPAGVVIHNGARIETGGFTATTRDISNDNFMKGNMVFDKPGRPDAKIINRGNITVRDSGLAALVAPTVRNEGIIAARLGKIALASGDSAFKLDMYGDDLIAFTVAENDVNQLYATDGTPLGVSNTGTIKAEGGVVLLSASQLDGIVSSVVNNGGTVTASSAEVKGGKIVFKGEGSNVDVVNTGTVTASSEKGDGGAVRMTADGKVTVSGTVEAKGAQKGGQVDVSGKKETVTAGVTINVEGSTGGLVRLGGEFQGGKATLTANADMRRNFVERFGTQAPLAETQKLTVDSASAISVGRDGTLVAWSGGLTDIRGALQGKYVETSGKSLNLQAMPIIHEGYLLIDPTNITISPSVTNTTDYFDGTTFDYSYEGSATVNAGDLAALLKTNNNVYLTASNSITIGPFGNAGESSSYRGTLDLSAQVIYVTGALNFGPGGVIFRAESSMSMASGSSIQGTGEIDIRGSALTLNAGARINSSRVDIWGKLDRNTAGTGYDAILQGIDVTLENNAGITATDRVEIYANTLTLNNAVIRSYNNLSIAGGRTGRPGPDNSSENDNSYQKNKDTLILGLNSLINASGHINLYIKGIQSA